MKIELHNLELVRVTDKREGVSKAGNQWKQETLLLKQTYGETTTQMVASLFGEDKIKNFHLDCEGVRFDATIFIDAKEWNNRYFNDVNLYAWRAEEEAPQQIPPVEYNPKEYEKDLPFD